MALTIYDIIKKPLISDKAYKLNKTLNQLVLIVHVDATKPMVKQAIEQLFNVKVKAVRTHILKYTNTGSIKRKKIARPKIKREKQAVITLAEGYSLDLFEQAVTNNSSDIRNNGKNT